MYIGRQSDKIFLILDDSYDHATGLTAADVNFSFWKQGETTWTPMGLLPEEFIELGSGFYIVKVRPEFLDTLGEVSFRVQGTGLSEQVIVDFVEPLPPSFAIDATRCIVSGNIKDLTGDVNNKKYQIKFNLVSLPQQIGGVSLISSDTIVTMPDVFGNFSVILLCGTTVMVEIEAAGIKNQIVIPNQTSANLIDLLPTF